MSEPIVSTEVAVTRETFGYAYHKALPAPFLLYKARDAWWEDVDKVARLFEGFAQFKMVTRAIIPAGITRGQYYYFAEVHPHMSDTLDTLTQYRHTVHLSKINNAKDWRASQYLLEKELPDEFGPRPAGAIPPGGAYAKLISEEIVNADGKIIVRRQTASLTENHGHGSIN